MADIDFAAIHCRRQRRVFLCDGDALIIPQKRLMKILLEIRRQLPWVTRVGVYANAKSLQKTKNLMKKYADLPMDFADATIVGLAMETGMQNVVTFDKKDFAAYRLPKKRIFAIMP